VVHQASIDEVATPPVVVGAARPDVEAQQVGERLGQVHELLPRLPVRVDVQGVAEGRSQLLHVEERLAPARLPPEHVAQQVIVEDHRLLPRGVIEGDVIERVLVRLETDHLDDPRAALRFLRGRHALGLAVLPFRCKRHLLDARKENGVEVASHLDKGKLATSAIFAVQVDHSVSCGARAREEIHDSRILLRADRHKCRE